MLKTRLAVALLLVLTGEVVIGQENAVRVGPSGFMTRDDKPFFLIGAYSPPPDVDHKGVAEMGFNVLSIGGASAEWGKCREAGLGIWHTLGLNLQGENIETTKASIRKTVETYRDHPNLVMWESTDEPAWTDETPEKARVAPEPLIAGYNFLKTLDPHHPVYLNHAPRNTIETLRPYNYSADILCVDVYPIVPRNLPKMYAIIPPEGPGRIPRQTDFADVSPAVVGDYVDKMKAVAFEGQPVFVVLQGFAWAWLDEKTKGTSDLVLYPSYEELRFMAYQAIVHGANGLTVWGLAYNTNKEKQKDLASVLNEIRKMEPFIVARRTGDQPLIRYGERGFSIDKGIECLVTETADTVTLFAVNAGVDPITARFVALPPAFDGAKELTVLEEGRTVAVGAGGFEDDFAGLGVHIYQFKR